MNRILTFFIILLVFLSCEKEEKREPRGEAILSSQLFGSGPYYVNGFSFKKGDNVKYPGGDVIPDVVMLSKKNNTGEITGAYLESPDNLEAFSLAGDFENASLAETFYNEYSEVQETDYTAITDSVKSNQVWVIKTRAGNYAKILTTGLAFFEEGALGSYVELGFRWEFQPEGSKIFMTK